MTNMLLRKQVILAHIPQVRLLAQRMHRRCPQVELDDLISAGTIACVQVTDGLSLRVRPLTRSGMQGTEHAKEEIGSRASATTRIPR